MLLRHRQSSRGLGVAATPYPRGSDRVGNFSPRHSHSKRRWSAKATMRVIMRSSIPGRVRPASCRAPCFGALLLPPTRLSVVGAYAIAATTARIADVRLPLERDEFGTGQHARRRPAGGLRPRPTRAGGLGGGGGGTPGCGRAG